MISIAAKSSIAPSKMAKVRWIALTTLLKHPLESMSLPQSARLNLLRSLALKRLQQELARSKPSLCFCVNAFQAASTSDLKPDAIFAITGSLAVAWGGTRPDSFKVEEATAAKKRAPPISSVSSRHGISRVKKRLKQRLDWRQVPQQPVKATKLMAAPKAMTPWDMRRV